MSSPSKNVSARARAAARRILTTDADQSRFAPLTSAATGKSARTSAIARAFEHNIAAAGDTASLPLTMAHAAEQSRVFALKHAAERIRGLGDVEAGDSLSDEQNAAAFRRAREAHGRWNLTEDGQEAIVVGVLTHLADLFDQQPFAESVAELHRQALVLFWGAFEVLARDLHEAARGTVAPGPKAAIKGLLGVPDAEAWMRQNSLWLPFQRRHLIVHRLAVVDAEYIANTGDALAVGTTLDVAPAALETAFNSLVQAAGILVAVAP